MPLITEFTRNQAYYLWRKWRNGDISESMISRLCTSAAFSDLFGGWFADWHYENLMESW